MKKIIHVNQHVIKSNTRFGDNEPAITVKTYKDNFYAHDVEILGPSEMIYRPHKPLNCGARLWIETESDLWLKDADGVRWMYIE